MAYRGRISRWGLTRMSRVFIRPFALCLWHNDMDVPASALDVFIRDQQKVVPFNSETKNILKTS